MLGKVRIVGSGLIGTSIGLGLVQRGIAVEMVDSDPLAQALARDLTGGNVVVDPDVVVFALPTSVLSEVIQNEIDINPQSTFMDVGSVKNEVLLKVKTFSGLSTRFLPTHPMAGREIGGAAS
ncbi:MAG: prephenate dehydrogenase/arogenate dehydrogenase family protein, partial [Micrococcales bacterium]|nr:prephenate dehydrogenase/arogenate dehydrogenase family protein [Micrococcales bacterium]